MAFAVFTRSPVRRAVVAALFACATLPALAGTEHTDASYTVEARVDRVLWQLVNDERYGHLQVTANYERLRTQLIEQACLVSAAPCLQRGEALRHSHAITAELAPEQEVLREPLQFTLRSASTSAAQQPGRLMVTTSE